MPVKPQFSSNTPLQCLGFDYRDGSILFEHVYTPTVHIDYSQLLPSPPADVTREQFWESLGPVLAQWDSMQHAMQDMLIELPQPGVGATRPSECAVVGITLAVGYKNDAEGKPTVVLQRNGVG